MTTPARTLPAPNLESRRRDRVRYRTDPVGFVREWLGLTPTPEQEQVLLSVSDESRTVARAANSVGKTFIAALVVCWWIECFEGSQAITTAPTYGASRRLLWKETPRSSGPAGVRVGC